MENIFRNVLLQLEVPIYLAYDTEDPASSLCDIIPLFFISENNENLIIKQ